MELAALVVALLLLVSVLVVDWVVEPMVVSLWSLVVHVGDPGACRSHLVGYSLLVGNPCSLLVFLVENPSVCLLRHPGVCLDRQILHLLLLPDIAELG